MLRIALVYGLISGLIIIVSITLSLVFSSDEVSPALEWLGYLIMLVALSAVFFGIKRHRDIHHGGVVTFWTALKTGLLITLFATLAYVVVWEVYLAFSGSTFIDAYTAGLLEQKAASGASETEIADYAAELDAMKAQYANPVFRVPITFLEIFPVGLVVSLISAAILRNPRVLPAST